MDPRLHEQALLAEVNRREREIEDAQFCAFMADETGWEADDRPPLRLVAGGS